MADRETTYIDTHLGARLRMRRRSLNLTQENVAGAIGVTFQQLQKYEKGTNRISAARLWSIAKALDVPVSWFFDGLSPSSDSASPPQPFEALAMIPAGPEMAEAYPDLRPHHQRAVLHLVRDLLQEEEGRE